MCGIWTRATSKRNLTEDELLYPIRSLAHRGPDGFGWFLERHVAMVHLRLSIIDLEGGKQPLASHNNRFIGIVNGELYDYKHHAEALRHRGVQFKTKSDSEVLLNLFAMHGPGGLSGLSGEFAFIFYDRVEGTIHFGRDPSGVKPLFMSLRHGELTLASEAKALDEGKPEFDEIYVKRFLARMTLPPRTAIAGAMHVLPGRVYRFNIRTGRLTWVYYHTSPLGQDRTLRGQESVDQMEAELKAAVRRRLVADVEVGCYLSGGIDSALVAALMVEEGAKPKAFTVGFNQKDLDESEKAARIANHLGIPHFAVQLSSQNFMENLKGSIVAFENPVANPHGAAKHLLSKLAGAMVKVVLSGEGSDEWFAGYPYFRIRKIREFAQKHPRLAKNALEQFLMRGEKTSTPHLGGSTSQYDEVMERYFRKQSPSIFSRLARARVLSHFLNEGPGFVENAMLDLGNYFREENLACENDISSAMDVDLWAGQRTDLFHYVLSNLGDRQEMAHALEGRTPFLDIKVADLAARVHPSMLIRGLDEKYILRRIASCRLPSQAVNEPKHPFFAPVQYLYARDNREELNSYIDGAREACPWLNWKSIDHLLNKRRVSNHSMAMANLDMNFRLAMFSIGVLAQHLREPKLSHPRGYLSPICVEDIRPHRFKVWEEEASGYGILC